MNLNILADMYLQFVFKKQRIPVISADKIKDCSIPCTRTIFAAFTCHHALHPGPIYHNRPCEKRYTFPPYIGGKSGIQLRYGFFRIQESINRILTDPSAVRPRVTSSYAHHTLGQQQKKMREDMAALGSVLIHASHKDKNKLHHVYLSIFGGPFQQTMFTVMRLAYQNGKRLKFCR